MTSGQKINTTSSGQKLVIGLIILVILIPTGIYLYYHGLRHGQKNPYPLDSLDGAKTTDDTVNILLDIMKTKKNNDSLFSEIEKNIITNFLQKHSKNTTANIVTLKSLVANIENNQPKQNAVIRDSAMTRVRNMKKAIDSTAGLVPASISKSKNLTIWDTLSNDNVRKMEESNFNPKVVETCLEDLNKKKQDIITVLLNPLQNN